MSTPQSRARWYRASRNTLRFALGLAALLLWALSVYLAPSYFVFPGWPEFLLTILVTAFMLNFSIPMPSGEGSLVHLVSLAAILAYSPLAIILAVGIGVLAGDAVRNLWRGSPAYRDLRRIDQVGLMTLDLAKQMITLLVATYGYSVAGGLHPFTGFEANYLGLIGFAAGFYLSSTLLVFTDLWLRGETLRRSFEANGISLFILEFLPVPFAVFGALLNRQLGGFPIYVILSVLVGVLAVMMRSFGQARLDAEQRLREIMLLNKVSEALRSTMDLDTLLQTIYTQVASVLNLENFYIALYDHETDVLSFRISIREAQRATWQSRPLGKRLTDYVISRGVPLRVPYNMVETLTRLGMEVGDRYPESWLGVPMIANERVIGCMAFFSYNPDSVIPPEAQTLMMTIAGPAGVAIENARMYEQTRRRAAELSTLTEIAAVVTSSLDPDHVLNLVCSSVIRVFSAQKSAIFLRGEEGQTLELAGSQGLTDAYLLTSRMLSVSDHERVRSIYSNEPLLITDIESSDLSVAMRDLAAAEGFRAMAELPLWAHGETIGFLAVFFAAPRRFHADEIGLLKTFASQVALAVANARLYARTDQDLARRVDQLQALEMISRELTSTFDLGKLFNVVVERAVAFTKADAGAVYLYNAETAALLPAATRGYAHPLPKLTREGDFPFGRSITARVQITGQVSLVPDVRLDPDYRDVQPNTLSQLSAPIRRENQTLGVITLVSSKAMTFDDSDVGFVSQLATQAAIAILNAQYIQRITEAHDRLTTILNSTHEGILVIDREGVIILCNTRLEDLWNLQGGLLLSKKLSQLLQQAELEIASKLGFTPAEMNQLLKDLDQGVAIQASKTSFHLTTSTSHYLERSITPVLDEHQRIIGSVIALRDITEEKEIQNLRDDLSAMIVHDLRSPMTAVLSSLKLIEDMFVTKDTTGVLRQAVEVSLHSSNRILLLVQSLLDISKMQAGLMELNRHPLPLRPLVAGLLNELTSLANQEDVILINGVPDDLPLVVMDQEKVERVLMNLIDNALKFTPAGGRVSVRTLYPYPLAAEMVLCQVLDTGPGIPADYLDRIFDAFAQVQGQLSTKRRGTGLGLTFCKLAVEAHGGRIWAENRAEGGSAFSFTLPMTK